jgi:hypothetical protein
MLALRISAILAAAALAACSSTNTTDVRIRDSGQFIPSARMSIDIPTQSAVAPSRPHTGHAIEFGATGGKAEDTQSLAAGNQPVVFGGQTFPSPNSLSNEAEFRYFELAYRYRKFFGEGTFGIEALGGLGYADMDVTVASAAQRASENLGNAGIVGGFGLVWRFLPATSLQTRWTLFLSGKEEGVSSASRWDIYLAQALGSHAAIRVGLAAWGVDSRREAADVSTSNNSPIRVRMSGPAIGLDVMF